MMNKKVTRKEFLLSALSIAAIFVASKVPSIAKNTISKKDENTYGNNSYGGSKTNA